LGGFFELEDGGFWSFTLLLLADFVEIAVLCLCLKWVAGWLWRRHNLQKHEKLCSRLLVAFADKSTRYAQSCFFLLRRRNNVLAHHLAAGFLEACVWVLHVVLIA
jgi:hypothetical protein